MIPEHKLILCIIGILLLLGAILYNIIHDYKIWHRQINLPKNIRRHKRGWRLKALTCLLPVLFLSFASNFIWVVALGISTLLCLAWFSLLFDGGFNIWRKEPFFWRGTEDSIDDAISDNFWQSIPAWAHITIKLVLSFGTAYLYWVGLTK